MLRRVRWIAVGVLTAIGIGSVLLMYRTIFVSGMGWDAAFESYSSLLIRPIDPTTTSLAQAYEIAPVTSEWYGVLVYQIADGIRLLLFQAPDWLAFTSTETYLWVFGVNAAYAIIGITIFAAGIAAATRSRMIGVFTWSVALATPMINGHAAMNYKDMPVAAGLCAISGGLMLAWRCKRSWAALLVAGSTTAAGMTMAVGARGGAVVLIALLAAGTLAGWALTLRRAERRGLWLFTLLGTAGGGLLGLAVVLWSNPIARIAPVQWLWDSIVVAGQYPWIGPIRVNGVDVMSDALPWSYVPHWLLAQLPLLTTALVAAGLILTCWLVVRPADAHVRGDLVASLPVYLQALVIPLAIILAGSVLYDAIRHLLFAIPALIGIAAIGLRAMATLATGRGPWLKALPYLIAVVVAAASFFACVRWYPYQYAFINPVAGWDKQHRNWELDYWGLSGREGVERLTALGAPIVQVVPNADSSSLFGGKRANELIEQFPDGAWRYGVYSFMRWENDLGPACSEEFRIERDGLLIGRGGFCPPPLEVLQR